MTDAIDELLAELRADVPEMSDAVFEAGRARLQAIVAPEPVVVTPKEPAVVPSRRKRLLRSPPRRLVASAAAVMVLAAGALAGQALWSGETAPVASAAQQLNAAADEITPVDDPIRPDQYRYLVARAWLVNFRPVLPRSPGGPDGIDHDLRIVYQREGVIERWTPADLTRGCTTRDSTTGNLRWIVGDEETATRDGYELPKPTSWEETWPCDQGGGGWWGAPSGEWLAALPRDPAQLYDRMRQESPGMWFNSNPDLAIVEAVAAALGSGSTPADLRAALYRALAMVPGLEITEQAANLDGRTGIAFGLSGDGKRVEVIIDPATGQFIGKRQISESGDYNGFKVPPGTVISSMSVSNPVVVDKAGETR